MGLNPRLYKLRGGSRGGVLGLHRYIEQYVYYPVVVHLSAFTVRSIILLTNAAILRITPLPERDYPRSQTALQLSIDMATKRRRSDSQLPASNCARRGSAVMYQE